MEIGKNNRNWTFYNEKRKHTHEDVGDMKDFVFNSVDTHLNKIF